MIEVRPRPSMQLAETVMRKTAAMALVVVLAPAVGRADLLPPGTKNIPIENRIEAEKDHPEWTFFVVHGSGGVKKVALDAKTPIVIPGSSGVGTGPLPRPGDKPRTLPYRASALVAVPTSAVKAYKTEKDLHAAVEDGKVPGMRPVNGHFFDHENAKAADPRKSIVKRYRITKLDGKTGATVEPIKDEQRKEEEEAVAAAPGSFAWMAAGLAIAGILGFAGLVLAARFRRAG
jgi:hypothetical protein